MNVQTAIAILLRTHANNYENVAATIYDYLADTYVGTTPEIVESLDTLMHNAYNSDEDDEGYGDGFDMSAMCELLNQYAADLAREFAYAAELCPLCCSDLDVCADDEECPGA